ncbi:MAG: DNA replication/repair protein RecF [Alphaproteobacteria bacterium]|nr:DNA replication/repair protein RecF [Alphaproteobacteria bacterium]
MLQAERNAGGAAGPEAAPLPLAVTRLTLTDFRNYVAERVEVRPRPVVLTGPNGAGKTNVLEALSYLTPGRGLRGARLPELARIGGGGGWSVAARIETPAGSAAVGTGIEGRAPDGGDDETAERRVVRIDGAPARGPAALAELVRVVWLTPQMDRLFSDGRSDRRRFLDRLVLGYDPEHGRRVAAYERVMRDRLKLLRDGPADDAWLAALEARMAEQSVAIAAARREAVMRLRGALAAGIGPFPGADLRARGYAEEALDELAAVEVETRLQDLLRRNRPGDRESGRTQEGAHRADLEVTHLVKGLPAALCSTGEQKALLVAVVLADARLQAAHRGAPPLLLMDEVAAHLDQARRAALFEEIVALGSQAWLTGTDRALFESLTGAAQFLSVAQGKVTGSDG